MKIHTLSRKDINIYHETIPMIKNGSTTFIYQENELLEVNRNPFSINMTEDEDTSLWDKIFNFDHTLIQVIEEDGQFVAGAITVTHSPDVNMLQNDMKNAALWDIRVNPKYQNLGYASVLISNSIDFCKLQNCDRLLIETQDNNPKAIKFYIKHGAVLFQENKLAYPPKLNEVQYIFQISTK